MNTSQTFFNWFIFSSLRGNNARCSVESCGTEPTKTVFHLKYGETEPARLKNMHVFRIDSLSKSLTNLIS